MNDHIFAWVRYLLVVSVLGYSMPAIAQSHPEDVAPSELDLQGTIYPMMFNKHPDGAMNELLISYFGHMFAAQPEAGEQLHEISVSVRNNASAVIPVLINEYNAIAVDHVEARKSLLLLIAQLEHFMSLPFLSEAIWTYQELEPADALLDTFEHDLPPSHLEGDELADSLFELRMTAVDGIVSLAAQGIHDASVVLREIALFHQDAIVRRYAGLNLIETAEQPIDTRTELSLETEQDGDSEYFQAAFLLPVETAVTLAEEAIASEENQ